MFLTIFIAEGADYPRRRGSIHVNSAAAPPGQVPGVGVSSAQEITMELADLNKEEQLALAGLLEFVVLASGHVTEDEELEIAAIVEAIGEEPYRKAVEEVDQRFPDEQALRTYLSTISRQEAREVIYGTVIEAAMTDTVEGRESALLEWLAKEWNIEVTYDEPPAGEDAN
jgi:recombinational DNA repair protein RecR